MRMTPDLYLLLLTCLMAVIHGLAASSAVARTMGNTWALGTRDQAPEISAAAGRLKRAYGNLMESLPIFAIVVLMSHVTRQAGDATVIGAYMFFIARVLYVPAYLYDWPYALRTLFWFVSIIALLVIGVPLVY